MSDAQIAIDARDVAVAASTTASDAADFAAEKAVEVNAAKVDAETARDDAEAFALGFDAGSATTLAPGATPTLDITGPAGAKVLNLGIPAAQVDDASLTAIDANAASAYRVQSDARLTATIATEARAPFQLSEVTEFVRDDTTTDPRPIDSIDGILYGATEGAGGKLWQSADHGDTWTLVKDFGAVSAIQGIRPLPDGEVLLLRREDGLFKSTGWATNPATATWANKVTPTAGSWILPWGVDVSDSGLCVAVEYAIPRDTSRNLWVSTDGGDTWAVKLDLKVDLYPAPGDVGSTHWHGACIDTFNTPERIWATHGDGYHGILYSDDEGDTFTTLTTAWQPTAPVAAEHGIIAGTDEIPDGLQFIERRTNPADMAVTQLYTARYPSGGLAYQGQRAVRDRLGRVLVGLDAQPAGAPALLLASPDGGKTAYELYRWTPASTAEDATLSHVVVDDDGYVYVVFAGLDAQAVWFRGLMVTGTVPHDGPEPSDKNSTLSKGALAAEGSGTAYGVGANAGADRGTATGYNAKATGSRSQGRGAEANASATFADADGYAAVASSSGAVAKGANAVAASVDALALGNSANSSHQRAVALGGKQSDGNATTTTAADQVQVGLRHLELAEITDPAAPAADKARLYVVDSTGITRVGYRTSAGISIVATAAEVAAEQARAEAAEGSLQDSIDAMVAFDPATTHARKSADTSRTATTTLTDDPHLTLAMMANATYRFAADIYYEATTAGDIKFTATVPAGAAGQWGQSGPQSAATSSQTAARWDALSGFGASGGSVGGAGSGVLLGYRMWGTVRTGATPGNLTIQWAQGTSDAGATIVYTDSLLVLTRLA